MISLAHNPMTRKDFSQFGKSEKGPPEGSLRAGSLKGQEADGFAPQTILTIKS
jgi:hypothetical protein